MNDLYIAWSAGLFDGEGSVRVTGGRINVRIVSTDQDMVENLRTRLGVGSIYGPYVRPSHICKDGAQRKATWEWIAFGEETVRMLFEAWLPFLTQRRKEQFICAIGNKDIIRRKAGEYHGC